MPPLEAWEKVYMTGAGAQAFLSSTHGQFDCTDCHQGRPGNLTMAEAHEGLIARPSDDPRGICSECHSTHTAKMSNSLHGGLWGYRNMIAKRYGVDDFEDVPHAMKQGFAQDCAKCHTSCGDCHVARPSSAGGGFVAGHNFGKPDMTQNCTACHGSRVGAEYRGENEGIGADVHYVPGGMRCDGCHSGDELHGDGTRPAGRLEAPGQPTCADCHAAEAASNQYHQTHWADLQCQVCHSQDYKSCNSCHAGEGLAAPSYMSFKIGKNPRTDVRSWEYVVLRHIPIAEDTFRNWGAANLGNYSVEPTWRYAAPHNIRRWTERTQVPEGGTCATACHESPNGTEGVFLRQADLQTMSPAEAAANRDLIVPDGSPVNW